MNGPLSEDLNLPGPCEGPYGTRRTFKIGFPHYVKLEVPDAVQDEFIRWQLRGDPGVQGLDPAYRKANAFYLLPEVGMRSCCYDVLRTKWIDPRDELAKISGWGHTCAGFFTCFTNYVEALRRAGKRGRIDLGNGITVPSPEEAVCLKTQLMQTGSLAQAYSRCEAIDIVPPTAILLQVQDALRRKPGTTLYEALKTFSAIMPTPDPIPAPTDRIPIHHMPPDDEDKEPNYWLYIGIGVGAVVLLTR